MKTWNNYKDYVKRVDPDGVRTIEEIEELSAIVGAVIEQRNIMGISQRELASMCGMPQSSIARIESFKTIPNLETVIRIMQPLGLKLTVNVANK